MEADASRTDEQLVALELSLQDAEDSEFDDKELLHEVANVHDPATLVSHVRLSNLAASQPAASLKLSLASHITAVDHGKPTRTSTPDSDAESDRLTRSCFAQLRAEKGEPHFSVDELMNVNNNQQHPDSDDDEAHSISELTAASVNTALSRLDLLTQRGPSRDTAAPRDPPKQPIVVVVNATRPAAKIQDTIQPPKPPPVPWTPAIPDDDGDDLTNLSWLQNTNLLQQLQTAANDRGQTHLDACLLSPVDAEPDSDADSDTAWPSDSAPRILRPESILFGDSDVQASQYVTVGDENNADQWQCDAKLDSAAYDRPPYSLNSLIFMAIESSALKCLPVRDIYEWITAQFPYYRRAPSGWKNSIRHTLSLGRCFKRFIADLKAPADDLHDPHTSTNSEKPQIGSKHSWTHPQVANASCNAKTHLNAFAKGALWMVDPDQRPALIQGLHRTLWELRNAARSSQRPTASLYAPSAHLAPLLGSSIFGPAASTPPGSNYPQRSDDSQSCVDSELEKKIIREMGTPTDNAPALATPVTPAKSDGDTSSDADMNAVHALVALKSAAQQAQQNLVANLLSEAVAARSLDSRAAPRGRGRRAAAQDVATPTPPDHDYLRCCVPSPAPEVARTDLQGFAVPKDVPRPVSHGIAPESINVSSMGHDGTLQDEVVSAASLEGDSFFASSPGSSPPRRRAARKTKPEFRLIRDAQCVVLSDLPVATQRCSAEKRSRRLTAGRRRKRVVDEHCDCCKCSRRQYSFGSASRRRADPETDGRLTVDVARLTRTLPARTREDANQNEAGQEDDARHKRKHRSVINRSWKEYKRIISRRRKQPVKMDTDNHDDLHAAGDAQVDAAFKVARLVIEKLDAGIKCGRPHTMVTRSKSGRVEVRSWRTRARNTVSDGPSSLPLHSAAALKQPNGDDMKPVIAGL